MHHSKVHVPLAGAERDLNLTTGVARADHGRFRVFHVPHFPVEKLHGNFRLREVVAAGGAATPIALLERHRLDIAERGKNLERLLADLECVKQMARVMIRDFPGRGVMRLSNTYSREKHGNVHRLLTERLGPARVDGILRK